VWTFHFVDALFDLSISVLQARITNAFGTQKQITAEAQTWLYTPQIYAIILKQVRISSGRDDRLWHYESNAASFIISRAYTA
jgi:hypothetical protein